MKIGIISDTHDNLTNLRKVLDIFKRKKIQTLIHCGDFCAPFVMKELKNIKEVHCVFGNTEDRFNTPKLAESLGINFHGDIAKLDIRGKRILVNHFPEIARAFAFTGEFDLVLHGHDHIPKCEKINNTLFVNPGSTIGKSSKPFKPSFAIYDTDTNEVEISEIE